MASDDIPKAPTRDFAVPENAPEQPDLIYYQMAGKKRRAHVTWYRGENTNFHPMRDSLSEPNAIEDYIGLGWFPDAPFISKSDYITAFGSCFASEVTRYLANNGYRVFGGNLGLNAYVIRCGEGIVNTAALRQQFEWAMEKVNPRALVWHDRNGQLMTYSEEVRRNTQEIFQKSDVFILTLGLSEVWYDKKTEDIFWRAIPKDSFDPDRHGFRLLSVDENRQNLEQVYRLIRTHRPDAHVIFTLSPVPLAATFRPVSCITANSVSKASLRVAVDELMRHNDEDSRLHYYPSYEIVTNFVEDPMGQDLRHPRPETVDFVMQTFRKHYLCPDA